MDVKDKIKHIVVLMLENRSLDNVLGWSTSAKYSSGERAILRRPSGQ